MNEVLAALLAGLTATCLVAVLFPPRRPLAGRIRPYAALGRSRLGTGYADVSIVTLTRPDDVSVTAQVFGPILSRAAEVVGGVLDAADNEAIRLRLRQAGYQDTDPEQYRIRQLGMAVGGLALGLVVGMASLESPAAIVAMGVAVGFGGATRPKARALASIESRRQRMQAETYTVAQLAAVHIRTGHGPIEAIRAVCRLSRGPVVEELREGLSWIAGGMSPQRAYDKLAEMTPEPAAARLYRLLSASSRTGGDVAQALLAVAADLRDERRESVARNAVKRRTAMLLPLLLFIAPVMVLYVAAALPHLVLG